MNRNTHTTKSAITNAIINELYQTLATQPNIPTLHKHKNRTLTIHTKTHTLTINASITQDTLTITYTTTKENPTRILNLTTTNYQLQDPRLMNQIEKDTHTHLQ